MKITIKNALIGEGSIHLVKETNFDGTAKYYSLYINGRWAVSINPRAQNMALRVRHIHNTPSASARKDFELLYDIPGKDRYIRVLFTLSRVPQSKFVISSRSLIKSRDKFTLSDVKNALQMIVDEFNRRVDNVHI